MIATNMCSDFGGFRWGLPLCKGVVDMFVLLSTAICKGVVGMFVLLSTAIYRGVVDMFLFQPQHVGE